MRLLALLALAACSYQPPGETGTGDGPGKDADRPDVPTASGPHLLLSEIFSEGPSDEFIEIFNPSQTAVALDHVYLTDVANYWSLPAGAPISLATDFLAKFPDGSQLAAGGLIVIAVDGPAFQTTFGQTPAYTLRTPTSGAAEMTMIASLGSGGAISDEGEMVVLFEWDGQRDLVRDIDIVVHGMPSGVNLLSKKDPVDGPDDNTDPTSYATDSNIAMAMTSRTEDGGDASYQRLTIDENEIETGGNGVGGHDETSEPLDTTWSSTSPANPGSFSF